MSAAVRGMRPEDAAVAAALEATVPDSWSEESIRQTLAQGHCCVAEAEGRIAGLCLCGLVLDEASVYAVTVDASFRRQGIARAMLSWMFSHLASQGAKRVYLEVRSQNVPARALYKALGFCEAGLRRGFYRNPADDAVLMTKEL
ncbi:ribosomal protein S18-alanine N-acetyltransferase [uncultured Ruthenibacterium sp.]|uniref:ribosomal protein S18-alanine N-acetyltransferase n=1 Tax=uncultured Ruthenibacterium sp. TaxID=1905347 RepID=UPI00349E9AF7